MTMGTDSMMAAMAGQWHHHLLSASDSAALSAEIWLRAAPRPQDRCIDLGSGIGALAVPLSGEVAEVVAIEPSSAMAARLAARAVELRSPGIRTEAVRIAELVMPHQSCDLIVSGMALHHCDNAEKRALVARSLRWLRPGGRLVIADLMPDPKGSAALRRFRLGGPEPRGRVRLDRSAGRFFRSTLHALRETTASGEFWVEAFEDAGFRTVGRSQPLPGVGVVWGVADPS